MRASGVPLCIRRVRVWVCRARIAKPVKTAFGAMHDRPGLLVEVTDDQDRVGYGEVWCNFPSVAAEYRALLIQHVLAPLLTAKMWASPRDYWHHATIATTTIALQSGEPGPFAQAMAGLDIALWDLVGRQAHQPLWRLLGGVRKIRVYASGFAIDDVPELALRKRAQGHRAFKLKVGFGLDQDVAALGLLRDTVGVGSEIFIDANQRWTVESALQHIDALKIFSPAWIEEPIRCDEPLSHWQQLALRSPIALAAGENLRGGEFAPFLDEVLLRYVQPDIGKWGGFSGCVPLGKRVVSGGMMLCPHWLGGGTGLLASCHLLAAVGGDGLVEWDANPNPLQEWMAGSLPSVNEGRIVLSDSPGLGVSPNFQALPVTQMLEHVA